MATQVATAVVKVTADSKDLTNGIKSETSKMGGLGTKAGTILKTGFLAGAAGIGAGLVSIVKSAVSEFSNFEQLSGGISKIFGEQAPEQLKNVKSELGKIGISANDAMEQATAFGGALKQAGMSGEDAFNQSITAIKDMQDNASIMGSDIESLKNAYAGFAKQQYTMLDNLKLGYGGTKTEMERLLADAEAITGKKYDITNLADVQNAIHAIQEEMNITGNASAEASETISGSIESVKAAWANLQVALVSGEGIDEAMKDLNDGIGNVIKNVMPAVKSALSAIIDNLPALIKQVTPLIRDLFNAVITELPDLLRSALNAIDDLTLDIAVSVTELSWDILKNTFTSKSQQGVKDGTKKGILDGINIADFTFKGQVFKRIGQFMKTEVGGKIAAGIGGAIVWTYEKIRELGGWLGSQTKKQFKDLGVAWKQVYDAVKGLFEGLGPKIKGWLSSIGNALLDAIKYPINKAIRSLNALPGVEIPELASGGIVTNPTLALIGEAGPEAVVPLDKLQGAGIGGATLPREVTLVDTDGSIIARTKAIIQDKITIATIQGAL